MTERKQRRLCAARCAVRRLYGLQLIVLPEICGFEHKGPRPVVPSGTLIIASGPAFWSPLNGVRLVGSKPHAAASCGLSNQKPTWNVWVGATSGAPVAEPGCGSASKPKI